MDKDEPFTQTDHEGRYALGSLSAGSYSLLANTRTGWRVSSPTSISHDVVLASDQWLDNLDFIIEPENAIAAAAPQIVTLPVTTAAVGQRYLYSVAANSRDGRPIQYSLALAPSGMVIDASSGQVVWTPTGQQLGNQSVIIRAATDLKHVDLQVFAIEVAPANTAPVVTSTAGAAATVDRTWQYAVRAQDAEQFELAYALQLSPDGATIDSTSGDHLDTAGQPNRESSVHRTSQGFSRGITDQPFTVEVTNELPQVHPFTIRPPRSQASLLAPYLSRISGWMRLVIRCVSNYSQAPAV